MYLPKVFELRRVGSRQPRTNWVASAVLHALLALLVVALGWWERPRTTFITLSPPIVRPMPTLPSTGGSQRGRGPSGGLGQRVPVAPREQSTPGPIGVVDSTLAVNSSAVGRRSVTTASPPNSVIWVPPRPALPGEVAELLYRYHDPGDPLPPDTIVVRRLRAMVDSMNRIIDVEQRGRRKPIWTTDVAGKKFGMDSSMIYVAGVKIPTPVLALLGGLLPPGNYDEAVRGQQLSALRTDIMQAAQRTQTLQEFRGYVKELRARKQAERDAARRQRDTVVGNPDVTP